MSTPYSQLPQGRGAGASDTRPPGQSAVQNIPVRDITQTEQYMTGPDNRPQLGYLIGFTTPSNTRATVFVPTSMYTVENVQAAIQERANAIEGVHKLAR